MNLRSLIPFGERTPLRPEAMLFGPLHREIDRLFDDFARGIGAPATSAAPTLVPSIDVTETDKEIVVTAELPGLERKDVEITFEDGVLTIRGEKRVEQSSSEPSVAKATQTAQGGKGQRDAKAAQTDGDTQKDARTNYHVAERRYGVFLRVLELPAGVDSANVQATMRNGVLKITIPKPARAEPKKIEVKEVA